MDSDDISSVYLILSYLAILSVKCRIYVISQGGTSHVSSTVHESNNQRNRAELPGSAPFSVSPSMALLSGH